MIDTAKAAPAPRRAWTVAVLLSLAAAWTGLGNPARAQSAAPVATHDTIQVVLAPPMEILVDLLANDRSPGGEPLQAIVQSGPEVGTLVPQWDGSFVYRLPAGSDLGGLDDVGVSYLVRDASGRDSDVVTACIGDCIRRIVAAAQNDNVQTVEGQGIWIPVLENDAPGLTLRAITTPPANGTATQGGSAVTYEPNLGFSGTDRFEYEAEDEAGDLSRAWVIVTVLPNLQPPVAVDDVKQIGAGSCRVINVTANDYDPDGGFVYLPWDAIVEPPQHGTLTGWGQQIAGFPPTVFEYCPDTGFIGTDGFRYRIHDGYGSEFSAEAWVTLEVIDVNLPPIALMDEVVIRDTEPVTLHLTANDYDVDGDEIVLNGSSWLAAPPSLGSVTRVSATSVTYTPTLSTGGYDDPIDIDTFSYRIVDATGKTAVGTVRLKIKNTAAYPGWFIPPWTALDPVPAKNVSALGPTTFSVLANDSSDSDMYVQSFDASGLRGQLTLNGNEFTYQPEAGYEGVETFTYRVANVPAPTVTSSGTVEIHSYFPRGEVRRVVAADEVPDDTEIPQLPPVARPDHFLVLPDSVTDLDVLANDSDENADPIQVGAIPQPPAFGTAVIVAGELVRYTPNPGFFGNDSFTYTATDGGGSSTTAVSVHVPDPDSPPAAGDDAATTPEDAPIAIAVLANDQDWDGDPLRPSAVVLAPEHGTATIQPGGTIRYAPEANWYGTDRFQYVVTDDDEGVSVEAAEVVVTVTPVNDPPTLQADGVTTLQDTAVTIQVLANDSDPEGAYLRLYSVSQALHGTASQSYPTGAVVYTPDPGYFGTDSFTYRVDDGGLAPGQTGYGPVTVTVTVEKDNHPPFTRQDEFTVYEEVSFGFSASQLLADDEDPDGDELSIVGIGQPAAGTILSNASFTSFSYDAPTDWCGLDSTEYTVSDGYGGTAAGILRIRVLCVNDPPVAGNDAVSVTKNGYLEIPSANLLANDSDVEGDTLTVASVGAATYGSVLLQSGGSVRYDAPTHFTGTDAFSYVVEDDDGGQATGQVTVTVLPDYPPVARFSYTCSGRTCTFDASATTDDGTLTHGSYRWDFPDTYYTWDAVGKTLQWTFQTGGTKAVKLQVTDSANQKGTTIKYLQIVEPPPVAVDDLLRFYRGYPRGIYFSNLLANDSDPGGDTLSVVEIGPPDLGTLDCTEDPSYCIFYPPSSYWRGFATMTYTISDGHGGTDTAILKVEYY